MDRYAVVGNPPYVRQELIPAPLLAEYRSRYPTLYDRATIAAMRSSVRSSVRRALSAAQCEAAALHIAGRGGTVYEALVAVGAPRGVEALVWVRGGADIANAPTNRARASHLLGSEDRNKAPPERISAQPQAAAPVLLQDEELIHPVSGGADLHRFCTANRRLGLMAVRPAPLPSKPH